MSEVVFLGYFFKAALGVSEFLILRLCHLLHTVP